MNSTIDPFRAILKCGFMFCVLMSATNSYAAIENRDVLKSFFETGDTPTEQQFANFIDSMVNLVDDGASYSGSVADAFGLGALLDEGAEIGPGGLYSGVAGLSEDWVGRSGFLGITFEVNAQTHYGYLQIVAGPDDQYPMYVEHLVYETQPDTPITATTVPEPASVALGSLCMSSLFVRRRGQRE